MKHALFSFHSSSCSYCISRRHSYVGQAAAQTHASTPAPPSTVTRPDSIQDSGFYNYWANMSAQGRAGGVLLGKLAMEGEPLPWEPMLVNVDCKGSIVNSTQADLRGQFVITFVDHEGSGAHSGRRAAADGNSVRGLSRARRRSPASAPAPSPLLPDICAMIPTSAPSPYLRKHAAAAPN